MAGILFFYGIVLIAVPLLILTIIGRKRPVSRKLVLLGSIMFIVAQIPQAISTHFIEKSLSWLTILLFAAIPGFWDEFFKFLSLKGLSVKRWSQVTDFTLGFAGFKVALLGMNIVMISFAMWSGSAHIPEGLRQQVVTTSMGAALTTALVTLVAQISTLAIQVGLAFVNAQSLKPGRAYYFLLAVALHTAVGVLPIAVQLRPAAERGVLGLGTAVVGLAAAALSVWYVRRNMQRSDVIL